MKKLLIRILLLLLPIIICTSVIIFWDPFRIFFDYKDYYKDNVIEPNRSFVLTQTYLKYRKEYKFDSFIFGSSRSHAFRTNEWKKYLDDKAVPFHYDGASETLYGINKKLMFLDKSGDSIKNVLFICDMSTLTSTQNVIDHLHILPPALSGESYLRFYFEFLKSSFSFEFIVANADYKINHKKKEYQKQLLSLEDYISYHDPVNGDYFYGNDKHISADSTGYYQEMINKGLFDRGTSENKKNPITNEEIILLKEIAGIFQKHHTNFKIVISPLYNQVPLDKEQLNLLNSIFDNKHVFDFSGKNSITDSIGNYYENSHYKPFIANSIMRLIYQ